MAYDPFAEFDGMATPPLPKKAESKAVYDPFAEFDGKEQEAPVVPAAAKAPTKSLAIQNLEDFGNVMFESAKSIGGGLMQWMADNQAEENATYGNGGADVDDASLARERQLTESSAARLTGESLAGDAMRTAGDQAASDITNEYEDGSAGYHAMGIARSLPIMAAALATRNPTVGAGAIGLTTAAQTRSQNLAEGYGEDEAELSAIVNGTIEGGFDALTLGVSKYGFGPLKSMITKRFGASVAADVMSKVTQNAVGRTAAVVAGGAVTETATSATQMLADIPILNKSPKSGEVWTALRDSAVQGALMSGAAYAAGKPGRVSKERADRLDDVLPAAEAGYQTAADAAAQQETNAAGEAAKADTATTMDIRDEQDAINKQQEMDAAFAAAEAERAAASANDADSIEAGLQTVEASNKLKGVTRLEEYAGVKERTPIQEAAPITPETVQAQREQTEVEALVPKIETRRAAAQAKINKVAAAKQALEERASKDESRRLKTARRARENTVIDELIVSNPDASPQELASLARARLAQPEAPVAPAATPAPTVAPATQTAAPAPASPAPVAEKADADLDDVDIDDLVARAAEVPKSLNMASGTPTRAQAKPDPEFNTKLRAAVKGLTKKGSGKSKDIQNLIKQQKIVFAPNSKAIGRTDTGAASFDTGTGKMYVYLDQVDANDTPAVMAAALHESVHAGQTNGRKGRDTFMEDLLTADGTSKAAEVIKRLDGKNALATAAMAKARAEEKANPGSLNYEILAHFASEAVRARSGFGAAGGVVRDMKAGMNAMLRKVGANIDVDINDVDSAIQKVGGEVARTEIKPADVKAGRTGVYNMIVGPNAANFNKLNVRGESYRGAKDNMERLEISDADAELNLDSIKAQAGLLKNGKDTYIMELHQFLNHDKLFEAYPQLQSTIVQFEDYEVNQFASYNEEDNIISVNKNLLRLADAIPNAPSYQGTEPYVTNLEFLRNKVLHETQHAVQAIEGFIPGANPQSFVSAAAKTRQANAKNKINDVIKNFDLGRAEQTLSPSARAAWNNEVTASAVEGRDAKAELFLAEKYYQDSSDRLVKMYGPKYDSAFEEFSDAQAAYDSAVSKAYNTYLRDYGETEARNTEARSRLTDEERAAEKPEATMAKAEGNIPVERTLDTTPYVGGARGFPASDTFNMAASTTLDQALSRKIPTWISTLVDSAALTGKEVRETLENAIASPTGQIMLAETYLGQYKSGIEDFARANNLDPRKVADEISRKLDKAAKEGIGYKDNLARFKEIAAQYGKAGEALVLFRNQVDGLSVEMLAQRKEQGTEMTKAEKKQYKAIFDNLGRYSHRQYASQIGRAGTEWAEELWANAANKDGKMNATQKANVEILARGINQLVDKVTIPDIDGLERMDADTVRTLYDVWSDKAGNPDAIPLDQMKQELLAIRTAVNGDSNRLVKQAEDVAKEIMGLSKGEGMLSRYYRGGKQDTGILQKKQNIPPEIRDLMGEIKDPAMRLFASVGKTAEFLARNRAMIELTKLDVPAHIQPPGESSRPEVKGMTKLDSDKYGPMQGYYVSPNLAALVEDRVAQMANFELAAAMAVAEPNQLGRFAQTKAWQAWTKVAGVSKMLGILGKPSLFLINLGGGPYQMLKHGNLNPVHIASGVSSALSLIKAAASPRSDAPRARRVSRSGVTDSAFVGEINFAKYKEMENLLQDMSGKSLNQMYGVIGGYVRRGVVTWKEVYSMMDVVYKLANFHQQADAVLPAYHKAMANERTQDQLDREAADITNRTNITFKRAAPLVKAAEQGGFTMYGPYFYEVFRTEVSNIKQGLDELKRGNEANRAGKTKAASIMWMQGAKRLTGQMAAWSALGAMGYFASSAIFGDDDDKNRKLRNLLPEYIRTHDFIRVGKDKDGVDVLADATMVDPSGPMTDIVRDAIRGEDVDVSKVGKSIFDLYIAPRVGTRIFNATLTGAGVIKDKPQTPLIQGWAPDAYASALNVANDAGLEDRTMQAWTLVGESFYPGLLNGLKESNPKPVGDTASDVFGRALRYGGTSLYKIDPLKMTKSVGFGYRDTVEQQRTMIKDLVKNRPELTEALVLKRGAEAIQAERKAWQEYRKIYEGMEAMDYTKEEAAAVLKTAGLKGPLLRSIVSGEFKQTVLTEKSMDSATSSAGIGKTKEEQKEIKAKWNAAWDMLKSATQQDEEDTEE